VIIGRTPFAATKFSVSSESFDVPEGQPKAVVRGRLLNSVKSNRCDRCASHDTLLPNVPPELFVGLNNHLAALRSYLSSVAASPAPATNFKLPLASNGRAGTT
jgi:hypothetical protein